MRRTAISLLVIQLANQVLPFFTLPIVTRALGAGEFGRMSFVFGVIAYGTLIVDYGFNLTATAAIAVARDQRAERSRIFWETLCIKALLAFGCAAVGGCMLLLLPLAAEDLPLYVIGFGAIVGSVLTPNWYFQGVERLPLLSALTLSMRLVAMPATLWCVKSPADSGLAMGINVGAGVGAALLALAYLWHRREVELVIPDRTGLARSLRDGWHVFISTAAISLYTNTNTVFLGVLTGHHAVAMFVAGEKIVKASHMLLTPLSQALYPRIAYLMSHDRPAAYALIRQTSWIVGGLACAMTLGLLSFAPWIVQLIYGRDFTGATPVLRVLALLPVAVAYSNLFGVQTMLPLGMKREFSAVLMAAGPLHVLLLLVFASRWGAVGAAASVVGTEFLVTVLMGCLLWRRAVPVFGLVPVFSLHGRERR